MSVEATKFGSSPNQGLIGTFKKKKLLFMYLSVIYYSVNQSIITMPTKAGMSKTPGEKLLLE